MKTWRRVPTSTLCGGCNRAIERGDPALFTKLPNVKRERIRGECCAGSAPSDLPPLIVPGEPVAANFESIMSALPKRTRGELKQLAAAAPRDEWTPYKD